MPEASNILVSVAGVVWPIALVLFSSPLFLGIINKTKALFAGRQGPPILQLYFDLMKLWRKDVVLSRTTTWVFFVGPLAGLFAPFLASLFLPLGGQPALLSFKGDFIVFAYILGMGRFATILSALDTGSAFEGMGSAREATMSALSEPAVFFGFLILAHASGTASLSSMLGPHVASTWASSGSALAAVFLSWCVVLLAENSRIPFDDPNTHLELTMVHEVMVLDHSGPLFAMIEYGASIKLFVFNALIVGIALPALTTSFGFDAQALFGALGSWALFLLAMVLVAVGVGVIESAMARLRLTQIPNLLVAASLIAAFGGLLLIR